MNLYSLLVCATIFAGGVCGAGPIFLSAKSRSMDEVPLRLEPLWRETTEGDRFSGCLVVYDWTLPGSATNAQAETLWEYSSVLSHDAPQGPDAPRVWNAMVHARRYETKQRVFPDGERVCEDLVCGSGFGVNSIETGPAGVASKPGGLVGLTDSERVIASGAIVAGVEFRLDDGRRASVKRYPDLCRRHVLYAIAVWPGARNKLSVYTAHQSFDAGRAISTQEAFRTVVDIGGLPSRAEEARAYPVGAGALNVYVDDMTLDFAVCEDGLIAPFRLPMTALTWPMQEE